ncbi:g8806 [Coccomyxa viridis]|uniref:G8806 protein n=1 Tax=Coccomyxa viridis TaxID=1274662 RepID=A0ABP1G813_9CHLO
MVGQAARQPAVDVDLERKLSSFGNVSFVLASARDPDMPILYASPSFYELTGFTPQEVLGHNCRFLHGPGTSRQKLMEIRSAIMEDRPVQVCLLNYKKGGFPFWNQFFLAPIHDNSGVVEYYLGIQSDVTEQVESARLAQTHLEGGQLVASVEDADCPEVVRSEESAAVGLRNLVTQWHLVQKGASNSPRHNSWPGAVHVLPTSLLQPLMRLAQSFVMARPDMPDCPIVYASQRFLDLTGYPREAVVGRNCRFLQGPGTDPAEVQKLRDGLAADRPTTVRLLNYKHDGTPFWNHLHVSPVRDARGKVVFYVGVQLDITKKAKPCEAAAAAERAPGQPEIVPGEPSGKDIVAQRGVCGAVRVACRGLCPSGLRRSTDYQCPLRPSMDHQRDSDEVLRHPPASVQCASNHPLHLPNGINGHGPAPSANSQAATA